MFSSVVPQVQVTERPTLTVTDHLKGLAGVDISQGGLVQANVVGRGFNNIFSGATLMLIDNRFASVPSLRVNVPAFFPAANEDIEKIEFVLGPGARALRTQLGQGRARHHDPLPDFVARHHGRDRKRIPQRLAPARRDDLRWRRRTWCGRPRGPRSG